MKICYLLQNIGTRSVYPYSATIFFVLKMLSAFYVCCIYSSALQTTLCTLIRMFPWEQSDLGPYCLQYRLSKTMSRQGAKVVTSG